MFDRILVPVDGSENGNRAVAVAAEMANCHGSSVYLLHVVRDLSLPREILEMISAGEVTASRAQILQDSANIILGKAAAVLSGAGVSVVERECVMGDPARKILEHARQNGVDLIILGQHGLGEQSGLMGGVARKLLSMTTVSCMVVV